MATEDSQEGSGNTKRNHSGDISAQAKDRPHYFMSCILAKLLFGYNATAVLLPVTVNVLACYTNLNEDRHLCTDIKS